MLNKKLDAYLTNKKPYSSSKVANLRTLYLVFTHAGGNKMNLH